jgi:HlyD family secretion protein
VLIGFDDPDFYDVENDRTDQARIIHAPIDGVVLQVIHQDETTLSVGSPILVVGNVEQDLEVVVELISSDAINVQTGDPVEIVNWGGEGALTGKVIRVEPYGETKVSALGVEEQRVTAVIQLSSPPQERIGLGHGFAVEAQIVVWSAEDALRVPSSALFREGPDWAVFVANDGTAQLRRVTIGFDNGQEAEVKEGLAEGDLIVLYPPADLTGGTAITQRVVE